MAFAALPPDIAAPTADIAAGAMGFAEPTAAFAEETEGFVLGEYEVVWGILRGKLVCHRAAKGKERLVSNHSTS